MSGTGSSLRRSAGGPGGSVLAFAGLGVERDGQAVLDAVDWEVAAGQRWVVVGPNGSGKTTLLRVAGAELRPSTGTADVLGQRLGRVDLRQLRAGIALVSPALTRVLRPTLTVADVVATGKLATLETWWHTYDDADRKRARALLTELGVAAIADRPFGVISEGERQQTLLARALMGEPRLLLLDEPAAGLDLGARERLLARLHRLATDPRTPPLVLVTHHVEEIPAGTTHAALLRAGRMLAAGPVEDVLTDDHLSACFGVEVAIRRDGDRWWARAQAGGGDYRAH
ncbi:MAG: ABC transporter ATP-binding protein [Acidimicrobiales bacterium]